MWIESMNSFEIQCNTEGLQIDKAGINTKIQSHMDNTKILHETWTDSSLQDSIKHFMCTLLGEMVLVRNVGHRCQANTENDLAKQLNSETVKT